MKRIALALLILAAPAAAQDSSVRIKAIQHHEYGPPQEVMRLEEIDKPVPGDTQVLIKVRAAAANPLDWHAVRGLPLLIRFDSGFFKPGNSRLGADVAGVVEAVGKDVKRFQPGDEVFGVARGAYGEYTIAGENRITLKPAALSFNDAAAMPVAAVTALQGLRDAGGLKAGQKVLVNGASGGVGTYAVQIAKALGADVTAVCSTRNVDLVKSLGADRVIDYTKDDFTKAAERYDIVLDNVGNHGFGTIKEVLTADGIHVLIGGGGPDDGSLIGPFGGIIWGKILDFFVSQRFAFMIAEVTTAELHVLKGMYDAGRLKSVIDRTFPLSEAAAAVAYIETGRARGKVVVEVSAP